VPHFAQPRPCPRRRPSARGRATTDPPPPLAGDTSGQATTANRERVSSIVPLCHMFTCAGPTSSAANLPRRRGYLCEGFLYSRV
jgi:hypothetical protein